MNLLFIHQNMPGQFRHLIAALAASERHRIICLGQRFDASQPGVGRVRYPAPAPAAAGFHPFLVRMDQAVRNGEAVAAICTRPGPGKFPSGCNHRTSGLGRDPLSQASAARRAGLALWRILLPHARRRCGFRSGDAAIRAGGAANAHDERAAPYGDGCGGLDHDPDGMAAQPASRLVSWPACRSFSTASTPRRSGQIQWPISFCRMGGH